MLAAFLTLLATALSLLVIDLIFPGVNLANFPAAMIAAVSIGVVNSFVRPVLRVLSLPLTIITLGLFSLVVNGVSFWLASTVVPGFSVSGLWSFLLAPVVLSVINTTLNNYFAERYPDLKTGDESELKTDA
ncbi:MAG: phage holin family protein [Elainellaceae cyanobacterium]